MLSDSVRIYQPRGIDIGDGTEFHMETVGECLVWNRDFRGKLDVQFTRFMPRVLGGAFGVWLTWIQ